MDLGPGNSSAFSKDGPKIQIVTSTMHIQGSPLTWMFPMLTRSADNSKGDPIRLHATEQMAFVLLAVGVAGHRDLGAEGMECPSVSPRCGFLSDACLRSPSSLSFLLRSDRHTSLTTEKLITPHVESESCKY
ncbi:uncharacterized protein LOC124665640 [Lolium rigidum]|uniref:uncharacterized protein LOC124665640 n=1 Tax=Lolium rigidum TaxID=89674 RepID=UPI001F5E28BD|nr:uncharacterized protein LOC124665640 [Lolium rigidum]